MKTLSAQEYTRAVLENAKKCSKKWQAAVDEYLKASDDWRKMLDAKDWEGVRNARIRIARAKARMLQIEFGMHNIGADGKPVRMRAMTFEEAKQYEKA